MGQESGRRSRGLRGLVTLVAVVGSAGAGLLGAAPTAPAFAASSDVPTPRVTGPVTGGLRNRMWLASPFDPASVGYSEKEFFFSGDATSLGKPGPSCCSSPGPVDPAGTKSSYKTQMAVYAPRDPRRFNGTVVVEWLNVTTQVNLGTTWPLEYEYLTKAGYAVVYVAAQKRGVDESATSLVNYDPVRYGSLHHPGDEYAWDIFSQGLQALQTNGSGSVDPLGGLKAKRVIATSFSQSTIEMITYMHQVQPRTQMVDGFLPAVLGPYFLSPDGVHPTVPTMWVNTETEATGQTGVSNGTCCNPAPAAPLPPPDGENLVYWEVAGTSHVGWWGYSFIATALSESETNGTVAPAWNPQDVGQYGERGGGACPQNFFPDRYAYHSALYWLNQWLTSGKRPPSAPRFERDPLLQDAPALDADGNVVGGLRLPPIDVPVATYVAHTCHLMGATAPFTPDKLSQLYPTHADYVGKMQQATSKAVEDGYLLPMDGCDLMIRAARSTIGGSDSYSPPIPECLVQGPAAYSAPRPTLAEASGSSG